MTVPARTIDIPRDHSFPAIAAAVLATASAVLLYTGAIARARNREGSALELFILLVSLLGLLWLTLTASSRSRRGSRQSLSPETRAMLDAVPAFVMCTTSDGEPFFVSGPALEFLGMTEDEVRDAKYAFVHPEDRDAAERAWQRSVATGEPYNRTQRLRAADGTYRWFQVHGEPTREKDRTIRQWCGVWTDVDARVRAEVSLKRSEKRLQLIIDTIPAQAWSAAPDFSPLYLNKRALDFMGTKLENHSEYDWTTTLHPDDIPRTRTALIEASHTGNAFRILHRLRRADGEYRWMEARADALKDENGAVVCWYGIDFDVHEQVQLQEANLHAKTKLAKASEVAMVAEVSASLAHEINQPLAAIASNAHACQRWLTSDPPNMERARLTAERLRRDAISAAELVERIRRLFRRTPPSRIPLDINAVIQRTLELLADRLESNRVFVHTTLDETLPFVSADPIQLQQVLVNLVTNAIEAMTCVQDPGLRRLELSSQRVDTQEIAIEVRDAGVGLTDTDRLFEPFFSTKSDGMGMGLAICRSIAEAHGGRLSAHANPVRGSTFRLALPLVPDESA